MFNFSRRINGITYYAAVGISLLVVIGASLLAELPALGVVIDTILGLAIIFIALLLCVYWVCIMRQRANDIGWHPLLVTLLAFWTPLCFVLGLIPGRRHKNKFGPPPSKGISLTR